MTAPLGSQFWGDPIDHGRCAVANWLVAGACPWRWVGGDCGGDAIERWTKLAGHVQEGERVRQHRLLQIDCRPTMKVVRRWRIYGVRWYTRTARSDGGLG